MLRAVQFVKRMGLRTHKTKAMCLPQKILIETEPPEFLRGTSDTANARPFSPATVLDRKDVGDIMKYWVKFDDGIVSSLRHSSVPISEIDSSSGR